MKYYHIVYKKNLSDLLQLLPDRLVPRDILTRFADTSGKHVEDDLLVDDYIKVVTVRLTDEEAQFVRNSQYEIEEFDPNESTGRPLTNFDPDSPSGYYRGYAFCNPYSKVVNEANYGSREDWFFNRGGTLTGILYHTNSVSNGEIIQPNQFLYGVDRMWAAGYSGAGISIGVIDSSMDTTFGHEDVDVVETYNPQLGGPDIINSSSDPHCLQRIGDIAARSNGLGVKGSAYNANIYSANFYNPAMSLSWLLSKGCKIINNSYSYIPTLYFKTAAKKAIADGCIINVAAGNQLITSPVTQINPLAGVPGTTVVGALVGGGIYNFTGNRMFNSTLPIDGKGIDFYVNGISVYPTYNPGNLSQKNMYTFGRGSSMSCAQFSGYCALMMEAFPNLPGYLLMNMLRINSTAVTPYGYLEPNFSFVR